ncbi:hypothetical protein QTP86_032833, partial [Hemibagrus guttatus]
RYRQTLNKDKCQLGAKEITFPSTSPAAVSFLFVRKKDGGLHPCINYRGLNTITIRYPCPLLLVPAALEQLRGAKYFTRLDLRSAYNLIRIREGDEWKTAFHTTRGHYEYLLMPFGPTDAPAVFQALINEVFQDMLNRNIIGYIDDILIYSTSFDEHVRHVQAVLTRLQHHQLYVKLEKCKFHCASIKFLGYVISQDGSLQGSCGHGMARTYYGSKSSKVDALSQQFKTMKPPPNPEPILSQTAILAPVQWNLVEELTPWSLHRLPALLKRFWWASLRQDMEDFIRSSATCIQSRVSCQLPEGLLEPLPVPQRPWSHLSMDFLTDLPSSRGFTTVMVVINQFSKASFLEVDSHEGITPSTTVCGNSLPTCISQFRITGGHIGALSLRPGCGERSAIGWALNISLSSSYHPQSNGQAEHLNQEIERFLRTYCSREQQSWSEFLPWAEYAQNSLTYTPFQCVLGYQPPLFPWSDKPSNVPAVAEWARLSQEVGTSSRGQ